MCRAADHHLLGVKGGRGRWQRDYLATDLLIWLMLILSHNHYDKFSCHDHPSIWVWAPYKTIFETKINRARRRHEMENFSASLALCEGNHWSPVVSPNKGPVVWAIVSLMLNRRNCLPNTQMASDRGHYDAHVTSLEWNFAWYIKICYTHLSHCSDVIMSAMVSCITGVSMVCSTVCSGTVHEFTWIWNNYRTLFTSTFFRTIHHCSS